MRAIQSREFERVGGTETLRADVRVVSATHRDLPRDVTSGRFREDLYYRINVVPIAIAPLRERPEDLGPLAELAFFFKDPVGGTEHRLAEQWRDLVAWRRGLSS